MYFSSPSNERGSLPLCIQVTLRSYTVFWKVCFQPSELINWGRNTHKRFNNILEVSIGISKRIQGSKLQYWTLTWAIKTCYTTHLSFSTSTTLEISSGALPDLLNSFSPASLCRASNLILLENNFMLLLAKQTNACASKLNMVPYIS